MHAAAKSKQRKLSLPRVVRLAMPGQDFPFISSDLQSSERCRIAATARPPPTASAKKYHMDGTPSRTTKVLAATKSKPPTSPPTWILWIVIPGCHSLRLIADLLLELRTITGRELLVSGSGEKVP